MPLWDEKFYEVADAALANVYDHKWWSPEFAASHPKVTFLMQVLNRHVVAPSKNYAGELREQIREQDKVADYAIGSRPTEFFTPIDMAKVAFTALMLEERALGLRLAMSVVMTAEDKRDFALLLSDVNNDRARLG